ncbi:hypothetical protein FPY71_11595 [Aureimonas fodinaquatilis]|uniref:Uncharacterized protein n=1 Tax=Aureimonas fodinaquatilis TaxID=2565783 RepID=A0A5B0DYJ6_9HYPH|nr:hypothetical protein [Aureimonas fodinaquatilis]KAA0971082.1 hypothetical protein FPY71_11595 [Aureimonas fodinaquatilis]
MRTTDQTEAQTIDDALRAAFDTVKATRAGTDAQNSLRTQNQTPAATAEQVVAAPDEWTEADQLALAALSPEVQALLGKRIGAIEAGHTSKMNEHAGALKLAEGVNALLDGDLRGRLQASGMDEIAGLQHLINLERFATKDPAGYLRFVVQQVQANGVDPAMVLGLRTDASAAEDDPFQDPRVARLQSQIGAMQQHLQQQELARQQAIVEQQITAFKADPRHSHHDAVTQDMALLLRADPKLSLEQAYERAAWGNPSVRQQMTETEFAKRQADERAKLEAAQAAKAARHNVRAGGRALSAKPEINNLDDAINAALAGLGA